jgi:DNA polymerase-4
MSSAQAYRLCPQAIFVKPRFEAYRAVSTIIRRIFAEYTEIIEPLSLDEAYLDVSATPMYQGSATLIAQAIKAKIKHQTELTASAGISYNKFLAKIASEINKPDGLYLITPEQGADFIEQLAIEKFHGIGKATAAKMHALGISSGKELKALSVEGLQQHFGKSGIFFYNISRGIDNRPVNHHRESKSVGVEVTFVKDIRAKSEALVQLQDLLNKAINKTSDKQLHARTLTVKIKYHDFVQVTRSRTLPMRVSSSSEIVFILEDLIKNTDIGHRAVRLLGVTLSSLENDLTLKRFHQMDMFTDY